MALQSIGLIKVSPESDTNIYC